MILESMLKRFCCMLASQLKLTLLELYYVFNRYVHDSYVVNRFSGALSVHVCPCILV